jgi:glutamate synthase (NADPH/NADH) large chain
VDLKGYEGIQVVCAEDNIVVGNTVLYGAISGECFFRGVAGERFAVRNSGATAVIEGVGDHGCEYMTGGVVACLGPTGRNFAAGMSGGIAYVLDESGDFARRCNQAMVELEAIAPDDEGAAADASRDLLRFDASRLKQLVERHLHFTGSTVARRLLANWPESLAKFVKVMPVDYRRALVQLRAEQQAACSDAA